MYVIHPPGGPEPEVQSTARGRRPRVVLNSEATKVGMYSATHERITVPVGRDRKIRTVLNQYQSDFRIRYHAL